MIKLLLGFFFIMFICSIAGLGGGIILKPYLDILGIHSTFEIAVITTVAILAMSAMSIITKSRQGFNRPDPGIVFTLIISSIIGAVLSSYIFSKLVVTNSGTVEVVQSILLIIVLLIVLFLVNIFKKRYLITNKIVMFIMGIILGMVSTFIGISGSVLNIAIFTVFFSMDIKKTGLYSLTIVMFAQISKLITLAVMNDITMYEYKYLPQIIIASLLAGISGSIVVKHISARKVKTTYNIILIFVILLVTYNLL